MGTKTTESTPLADYGPIQAPNKLGLAEWQFKAARRRGLIPPPDVPGGRWSAAVVDDAAGRIDEIRKAVGEQAPIGANWAATWLAERLGMDEGALDRSEIDALVERGLLAAVDEYKGWPTYDVTDLTRLADTEPDLILSLAAEREAWMNASLHPRQAQERLGWRRREFERVVAERGLTPGRFGRFALGDIEALAADEELGDQVLADRLLGPDQACAHLEIRRVDFDYLELAGLVAPKTTNWMKVGRYKEVPVPMYRTGDLDALRELPGLDLEAVRACRKGEPSPLRELVAGRPPTRAQIIRRFVAELGARHGIEVWATYNGARDLWEIDWEEGGPSKATIAEAIRADKVVAAYHRDIELATESGAAIRWARAMLEPGAAVIVDTETTDLHGAIVEIAVIDAATGKTLLNTLVNPGEVPISQGAYWVHGISSDAVVDAPTWPKVLPKLRRITRNKTVLAYNAEYDRGVVVADSARYGLKPMHLGQTENWGCVMNRRSDWVRTHRWLALGGAHRALGDCQATLEVLRAMTAPRGQRS